MPPPNETSMLEVAFDEVTAATHEVIAAASGKRHYIYAFWLWANGTVAITPQSAANLLTGPIAMVAQNQLAREFSATGHPWFTCVAGEAFNVTLAQAIQVSGRFYYKTY
jgi:hypothetical protein